MTVSLRNSSAAVDKLTANDVYEKEGTVIFSCELYSNFSSYSVVWARARRPRIKQSSIVTYYRFVYEFRRAKYRHDGRGFLRSKVRPHRVGKLHPLSRNHEDLAAGNRRGLLQFDRRNVPGKGDDAASELEGEKRMGIYKQL